MDKPFDDYVSPLDVKARERRRNRPTSVMEAIGWFLVFAAWMALLLWLYEVTPKH